MWQSLVISDAGDEAQSADTETGQSVERQSERASTEGEREEHMTEGQTEGHVTVGHREGTMAEHQREGLIVESQKEEDCVTGSEEEQVETDPDKPGQTAPAQEDNPKVDSAAALRDIKKAHRLSPDFPDSLFELLCTLQEGRRLNDQRCSFTAPEPRVRRRCHSEPNTTKPGPRVVFSSMTSLQREEFFDLVATAQARRLNDQRAQLERAAPQKTKSRSFRGSIRQLSLVRRPEPAPVPKEELYSMILHTQAQGRLEDQRSRAPGPMDDEVFFSLLLRVQGGRMDEQRTELPCT